MSSRYADTRQHILDTGNRIIAAKGFSCVGLNELLQASEVPKGSFYHYFKSKELFGQALLEDYFDSYLRQLDALLEAPGLTARERLLRYFQQWRATQAVRVTLRDGTERIIGRLAGCIAAGVADASLPPLDADASARMLYQMWLGASLLAKLQRNASPLDQAWAATLQRLSA